ncbi:MAG TPA: DUF4307 domain-containing protein [Jiangellaceae bacterium]
MTTHSTRPADRYGDRRPGLGLKLAGALVGVALAVAAILFIARASDSQIEAEALSYEQSDGLMTASIEVLRRPDTVVRCDVVAVDIRQIIVGQTELVVPATSDRRVVVDVDIPLQGDGVAVSVRGCEPSNRP